MESIVAKIAAWIILGALVVLLVSLAVVAVVAIWRVAL